MSFFRYGSKKSPSDHSSHVNTKTKLKWSSSEPLQTKKITRHNKNKEDIVVLMGDLPSTENGSLPCLQREMSGRDSTTEDLFGESTSIFQSQPSQSHSSIVTRNITCSTINILNIEPNEIGAFSFEGLIRQNINDKTDSRNFELEDGVFVDELSDSEYQYLKPLLYVDLFAIFKQHKISWDKKKTSSKRKGGNVFEVNLSTLVKRDMTRSTDNSMVPQIFQVVLDHLNLRCLHEEGILRVAGQKQKLENLCGEIETTFYNDRRHIEELFGQATAHELTGVLKRLLRDLPDPIFTTELYDMFYKTGSIPHSEDKIKALNLLVLLLPIEHRNTSRLLLQFLLNIIENEQKNRMSLHNVAMIAAPSFFPPKFLLPKSSRKLLDKRLTKEEMGKQINGAAVCCGIMETLLQVGNKLWKVPRHLAVQGREAHHKAQVKKDMGKNKDLKIRSGKTKLVKSSTQCKSGAVNLPGIKNFFV